ncbi:OLC1v1031105C1 [Oldenlandia corymbosa var. corymbosa]|uniref:OLC1v1031105C1 n=1 Tax=Oldenlandia corymbosa var. corymbosa TaxID=529605 RepID=A0AAV1CKM2_OLDCO|nr:OLC1v1031105C1 [Oldenlandia corymbosa var. corymbosa]
MSRRLLRHAREAAAAASAALVHLVMWQAGNHVFYTQNPLENDLSYRLPLDFIPAQIEQVSLIGDGLLLLWFIARSDFELGICNPFTREFRLLPRPRELPGCCPLRRYHVAVGVVGELPMVDSGEFHFRLYVVGGAAYFFRGALTAMNLSSQHSSDSWTMVGPVPKKYSVSLIYRTGDQGVYSDGVLYWIISVGWAQYSLIALGITTNTWKELAFPTEKRHYFSTLWRRKGKLMLTEYASED